MVKDKFGEKEKIFKSFVDVVYYFEEEPESDWLLVVFSAVNPPNKFTYNYVSTLNHLKCNKLFILDKYGEQGAYYLGENRSFIIETSVVSLLNYITRKYNIQTKDIITAGSSKGGYSALYYGIKYQFGYIVAGGPQTKLGEFLFDQGKNYSIAEYIAGDLSLESKEYLNSLLYTVLSMPSDSMPDIYIHVGNEDHHYQNHVIPFTKELSKLGVLYHLDVKNYDSHDGLRQYFPPYLTETLCNIMDQNIEDVYPIKLITIENDKENLVVECITTGSSLEYAFYIYKDEKILEKIYYTSNSKLYFPIKERGRYKCKVFVKNRNGNKFIQMSDYVTFN